MSLLTWIFGEPTETDAMRYLASRLEEQQETLRRAHALESAYIDLRRALTSRCCRNGRDNPTLEPLASILRAHDAVIDGCGYSKFVPR